MIFGKLWHTLMAQVNKIANIFWTADPIAQMQYEYDQAVAQLKDGREGLERYRALVERVTQQVTMDKQHVSKLEAQVKAYLTAGDRDTASRFALELQKAKTQLAENEGQLKLHEEAYTNNVTKIKHASSKLGDVRTKIQKYDADLKMSRAEAEMAKLAGEFNFDVTTDFGQIEQVINDKIGLEPGQGPRRGRHLGRGSGRHPARAGDGKGPGRSGPQGIRGPDGARHARDDPAEGRREGTRPGGKGPGENLGEGLNRACRPQKNTVHSFAKGGSAMTKVRCRMRLAQL